MILLYALLCLSDLPSVCALFRLSMIRYWSNLRLSDSATDLTLFELLAHVLHLDCEQLSI